MKKALTLALTIALAISTSARQLTPEQAFERLTNPGVKSPAKIASAKSVTPAMAVHAPDNASFTSLYVFENGKTGYLIVSADDCAVPLLGYSDSEAFDINNIPPQLQWWLDFYAAEIRNAAASQSVAEPAKVAARPVRSAIKPLLSTLWDQSSPYNNDCPMDGSSRSVTGCVATAMAQAMKYHEWPTTGSGKNSYSWNGQTLSLDFANITFDWSDMTDSYGASSTSAQNAAVAQLMYACGISVNMDYSSSESGASSLYIAPALYNYFGYSGAMVQPQRAFYGLIDWENMVYEQLAEGIPVLYGGQSKQGGHQFVCDGYSEDGYFHFNWGWSGTSDGYYLLSALDPLTQGIGGSTSGFNYDQGILLNMTPSTNTTVEDTPLFYCYGNFEAQSTSVTLGRETTFLSSDAFYNFGCKEERGYFGIKIVDSNGTATYAQGSSTEIPALSGIEGYYVTIPGTLASGTYTVTPVFRSSASGPWIDVLAPLSGVQALTMTVANRTATFSNASGANIKVTDFSLASNVYIGTNFKAEFTISNSGTSEYYGELMIGIADSSGNIVGETSSAVAVDLIAGESSQVSFIGMLPSQVQTESGTVEDIEPGQYTLVIFDSLTGNVVYVYPSQINVQTAPSSTSVQITNFGLANGVETITDAANVKFNGTVTCTQGYYANQLKVAIFPYGATTTSIQGSSDFLFLDKGQSSSFTVTVDLSGNPDGQYFAAVFDSNNRQLTNPVYFEISDEAGIRSATLENADNDTYYNMQGVEIAKDALTPGFYIVRNGSSVSKVYIK